TNAIKYAVGASDAVRVTVRIGGDDGIVSIEFRDNGPGYPDDVLRMERHNVGFDLVINIVNIGLRGSLYLRNDGGAVAVVRFPADAALISEVAETATIE
ncbi:MAG: sensor histidine kinase, partial [Anaerolineales bacterium]|nr:sensor histidine kinase [Anaerolineales bacterium]